MRQRTGLFLTMLTMLAMLAFLSACGVTTIIDAPAPPIRTPLTTPTPSGPAVAQNALTLGGSMAAFNNKFSPIALLDYGNGWTYLGPLGKVHTVTYAGDDGMDYDETSPHRVFGIQNDISRFGTAIGWTIAQAKTFCASFAPADAKLTGTTTLYEPTHLASGFVQHYTSVSLANTLPTSDFVDANGKAKTPGTFFIDYGYMYDGPDKVYVDGCILGTNEHYMDGLPV
jgi:hypothetical protein